MTDIVDSATRSRMMSGIRGKNTIAEVEIRKRLFASGFRYRLHDTKLPGKPDIIFPRFKAVIFIHGCFWHAHNCHLFKWPSSRKEFWKKKLGGNIKRDNRNIATLKKLGWRVLIIWECAFRGQGKRREKEFDKISMKTARWLTSQKSFGELKSILI